MKNLILDPEKNEDFVKILTHKRVLSIQKESILTGENSQIENGAIREGKVDNIAIGDQIILRSVTGVPLTTTTPLKKIDVDDEAESIKLHTQTSVYKLLNLDSEKDNRTISLKYLRNGYLDFNEKMLDGFYDGGRHMTFYLDEADNLIPDSRREVVVLDNRNDVLLENKSKKAGKFLSKISNMEGKITALALYVSSIMGGNQNYDGSNSDIVKLTDMDIESLKKQTGTNILAIGYLDHGVCRHRALLFKYLADRNAIPSRLVRGDYGTNGNVGGHVWNVVKLGEKFYIVDVMHDPTELFEEGSEKAMKYKRKNIHGDKAGLGGRSVRFGE